MEYKQDPSTYTSIIMYPFATRLLPLTNGHQSRKCIFDSTYWLVADVCFHASDTLQRQSLRKELEQSI